MVSSGNVNHIPTQVPYWNPDSIKLLSKRKKDTVVSSIHKKNAHFSTSMEIDRSGVRDPVKTFLATFSLSKNFDVAI